MPIYTYKCECGRTVDAYRKIADRYNAPECCGNAMEFRIMPTMVSPDIQPYKAVAYDQRWIKSRKEHREFLKEFDAVEIG